MALLKGFLYLPISWSGYLLPCRKLEGVHHSKNLIKVTSSCGRVKKREFQSFVRANDENLIQIQVHKKKICKDS